jgi:hypothetical protein
MSLMNESTFGDKVGQVQRIEANLQMAGFVSNFNWLNDSQYKVWRSETYQLSVQFESNCYITMISGKVRYPSVWWGSDPMQEYIPMMDTTWVELDSVWTQVSAEMEDLHQQREADIKAKLESRYEP